MAIELTHFRVVGSELLYYHCGIISLHAHCLAMIYHIIISFYPNFYIIPLGHPYILI